MTRLLPALGLLLALGAWALHGFQVLRHAIDVPFYDDWAFLHAGAGRLEWLFGLVVDHRVVPTKLLIWLLEAISDWDLALHQRLNWGLFTLAQIALGALLLRSLVAGEPGGRALPRPTAWLVVAGFAILQLSTLPYANHVWAVQSAVHFFVLFSMLAAYGLFHPSGRLGWQIAGMLSALVVQLTQAAGVVVALILAAGFTWSTLARGRLRRPEARRRVWTRSFALGGPILTTAVWVLVAHQRDRLVDYPRASPMEAPFWRFLFDLIAFGFGIETRRPLLSAVLLGAVLLGAVIAPAAWLAASRRWRPSRSDCGLLALAAALLACLALIAWGRAELDPAASKASRYAEIATLLVPLAATLWLRAAPGRRALGRVFAIALWSIAALGLADDWDFSAYRHVAAIRIEGRECAAAYWRGVGPADCPGVMLPHQPQRRLLERARKQGLHVVRATEVPPAASHAGSRGSVEGIVDGTLADPERLVVRGWAVDRATGEPAAQLHLLSRGRRIHARLIRAPRPDVARAERLAAAPLYGFELHARRSAAPVLSLDGITVEAVDATGGSSALTVTSELLSAADPRWRPALRISDGRRLPLRGDALEGRVSRPDAATSPSISGWAIDPVLSEPAERFVVVDAAGRTVFELAPNVPRPAVAQAHGLPALRWSGFRIELPSVTRSPEAIQRAEEGLRVLAVTRRGAATELEVAPRTGGAQR